MSPCSCQMKLIVSSNDCWLQEWDAFSNTLVWIIHICRYNEAHENSNIYICEVYVQYIFQTCIFFHYLFSDKQALPNTINNYFVCVCVCVRVCVCVCACVHVHALVWKRDHLEIVCKSEQDSGMSSTSDILFHNQVNESELIFYHSQNLEVHWHIHKNLWCIHYLLSCDIMQSDRSVLICQVCATSINHQVDGGGSTSQKTGVFIVTTMKV